MLTENEKTSERKFEIKYGPVRQLAGKTWAKIYLHGAHRDEWVPSLADMYRIAWALAHCEELKYPSEKGFAGSRLLYEFLMAAANAHHDGRTFADLCRQFEIPERTGDGTLIRANGARLPQDAGRGLFDE